TGIVVVDQAKKIKLINSAAIQLLGGTKTQPLLKPGSTLSVVPELRDQFERWATYPWLRTPTFQVDQSATQLQANFTQLKTAEAESTLIFIEDTRSLSQHAQQLKLSSLGRLTGSIAHEIRNPLGAISHAAQLLQDAEDPEQTQKLVDIIYRHSERVNQIVDDILKLSSQDQPAFQKVWLQQWLKKFSDDYLEGADDGGVIDTTHLNGEFQVTFDTRHLSRIITNLLDNAFKYSRRATGSAWAKLVTGVDDSEMPFLEIHDRGEGVPEENIDKIFEPFFTTTHEGSGLGLYISRELCTNNFATLSYVQADDSSHYFRLGFAHPDQLLPRTH
ncbi:MAG: sensor histidine kinase, partial [bacterium]